MRYKKVLGYILILFLVISNVFNYSTSAQYRTEFDLVTETIMAKDNDIKDMEILVSHIDIETNEKLEEDELITKKVGEEVIGDEFKKDIIGYSFEKAEPEKIIVSEESKEIKLYYKKDEVIPDEKYVDVTIHHYLIDSTEKLAEDDILKDIKVGTSLETAKYLKEIEEYDFKNAESEILEVTEENTVIKLYYDKKEVVPPVEDKYVDITVNYFAENTTTSIKESKILEHINVGTIITSLDYKEDIADYTFISAEPEQLEVSEENKTINLYYKENDRPEEEKYVDVTIRYIDKEEKEIELTQKLENIEIGTMLKGRDYIKEIEGYDFKYSFPEILEVRKDNTVIKIYYDKKDVIPPVKYVDVTVNYFVEDTTTSIIESQVLKDVKVGTVINSISYKKDIKDYNFISAIPEQLQVSKENKVINLYYRKNEINTEEESVDIIINHFISDTDTKIVESDVLEAVKVGTILLSKDYIKNIDGYKFDKVLVESLEVNKDNNIINIYYKKIDTTTPGDIDNSDDDFEETDNNKSEGDNEDLGSNGSDAEIGKGYNLPETGGNNIIWLGYILILLGIIINSNKKEDYAE